MIEKEFQKKLIKVSVVDDDKYFREYLIDYLTQDKRVWFYGEYIDGTSFIEAIKNGIFKPDVCLIDILLGDMSGIECAKSVRKYAPDTYVVLMTSYPKSSTLAQAKKIGADYIEKGTIGEYLLNHIVTNLNKNKGNIISLDNVKNTEEINYILLSQELEEVQKRFSQLTENQIEIIKLKKQGKNVGEIAKILKVKETTVYTQIQRAMKKLNLPDILKYLKIDH